MFASFLDQLKLQSGLPVGDLVRANFPPGLLQCIDKRVSKGGVKHERVEVRQPERNSLLALRFD